MGKGKGKITGEMKENRENSRLHSFPSVLNLNMVLPLTPTLPKLTEPYNLNQPTNLIY
jgi:hypothetical protein